MPDSVRGAATILMAVTCALGANPGVAQTAGRGAAASADSLAPVVIRPVESNLSEKFWTSESVSSGAATAALATDGDPGTGWTAAADDPSPWLTLDLGGLYDNVRKVEVVFPDAGVHRYLIDASTDGEVWETIADQRLGALPRRGGMHLFTRPGTRFLRVGLAGLEDGARAGISELRVFNYLRDDLVLGADLSMVDNFRDRSYFVNPNPGRVDMGAGPRLLDVVKDRGMDFIRLRIWNEPRNERTGEPRLPPTQGPERSLEVARWVAERNLMLGIDFHYADSWADPGKQPKPRAWAELEFDELVTALHDFTADYLRRLVAQGTPPDKVAIGNEIINGFLWGSESRELIAAEGPEATVNPPYFREQADVYQSRPGGRILWRYWKSQDADERRKYEESWDRFATLVAAGMAAAREASPTSRVELHTIVGSGVGGDSGLEKTMEFWDQLLTRVKARGQEPDVLAISYYAEWHGTVEQLDRNLHTIATTYPEYEVNIAETAYPASGGTPQPNSSFPRTVQGQADAIQRVFQAANDVVDNRGVGVLLWEPASFQSMFRPVPGMENHYAPLPSIDVFNRSHAREILEDRVYVSLEQGESLTLPPTVRMLTAATGDVANVPVVWQAPEAGAAATGGRSRAVGRTQFGEVTALIDRQAR